EVSRPDPKPEPEPDPDPVDNERIINGGFEDGTTAWFANNTYSSDGATLTVVEDDKTSGDYALYVSDRKSTGSGPMQDMTGRMVAGGTYQVSARIKYNNENGPANRQFYMTLRSETPETDDNIMKNIRGARINKGQWGTISGTYTVPADADNSAIAIFLETSWTSEPTADRDLMDFWVDDVSIKVISEPEPEPELGDEIIVNGGLEAANEGEWIVHTTSCDAADVEIPKIEITDADAHTGDYSVLTTDRMAVGVGPQQDLSGKLIPGATYDISAWVKYTNEESPATKGFAITFKHSGTTWQGVASGTATKGEWSQIKASYTVPKDADVDDVFVFIETTPWTSNSNAKNNRDQHLFDFYADDISIKLASLPPVGDPLEDILEGYYTYNGSNLNNVWQWNHNPDNRYWSLTAREGWLRLTTGYKSTGLLNAPNTLSQRTFGPQSSAVIKMDVSKMNNGDVAGLSLFTAKYGAISVRMNDGKKTLAMTDNTACRNHTDESGVKVVETADLTSDIIYLKADADFANQTDRGYFYYSYDGMNWTQLGSALRMSYSTSNHFMGYRFNIFNYATTTVGGYVDIDYYRISDKLTGASETTVLTAEMQGASNVPGTAVSTVDVPVLLDTLPDGVYSEVAASFNIPADLTVEDVVLGDGVVGDLDWEVNGKQLEVTVTGDDVALAAGKSVFVTLKLRVNELQANAKTLTVTPDYVIVRGDQNVAYNVDGVKADIRVLATEDGDAWAKVPGYNNNLITHKFGADPFAMEYNGRLYIYMTSDTDAYDIKPDSTSNDYGSIRSVTIISSDDMVNWTDHGKVEIGRQVNGVTTWANNSWAPAAAHKTINGEEKFFLYFCDSANGIGVLTADSPIGPWTDPIGKALVNRNTPNCGSSAVPWCFDPAVFVDEDGTGYLYFGGGIDGLNANNPKSARCVQLGDDMTSIVGTPVEIDAPRLFEDSGMHKREDIYYYSYCSNFSGQNGEGYPATGTIAYMVSKSPLGPFTYAGEVLPGPGGLPYGDGGNNHHAIFDYEGRTFIVYHNRQVNAASRQERGLSGAGDYRSPAITELFYDSTNRLVKSRMEMEGVKQLRALNPYVEVQAETIGWQHGIKTAGVYDGDEP
ncbi:MAG: carbohydrate binding domain-containing protein, partial [Oscillospiraceae bacterium]|nr:carbohydrate binding domain-containing protein [Oscillospiraceae bacterium]